MKTTLLKLNHLSVEAIRNKKIQRCIEKKIQHFNLIQTQVFHVAYNTDENILLGAPTGSGKTIIAELLIFRCITMHKKAIYIAPLKALANQQYIKWKEKFKKINLNIILLVGDSTVSQTRIESSNLIITTPEKWDGITRYWKVRKYIRKINLLIMDEIHLLGQQRGSILEIIVSQLRFLELKSGTLIRILGLSTSLANAMDLADWFGCRSIGLFNFPPSQRLVPCNIRIMDYPEKYYCARMKKMNKSIFETIKNYSLKKPVLIFVSSRRQTRLTAIDLITFVKRDNLVKTFLKIKDQEAKYLISKINDKNLKHTISFGIGIHHAGLVQSDRKLSELLFTHLKIQILISTSTLAWGLNLPVYLVIIKGVMYYDSYLKKFVSYKIVDILQMIGRAGRPQFDTYAEALILCPSSKKTFYKKFLYEPFPLESSLHENFHDHLNAEIAVGNIQSIQDAKEYLTWTFLFKRLTKNPSYYQIKQNSQKETDINLDNTLDNLINETLLDLKEVDCIKLDKNFKTIMPTFKGKICSYFYLKTESMELFQQILSINTSLSDLLRLFSYMKEYKKVPVRHNENKLNEKLSKMIPWSVDDLSMNGSTAKILLLLQIHFSKIPLPISDYMTDTQSIIDQALRILQAMIDVISEIGLLNCTIKTVNLTQMVTQGNWLDDCSILVIPYIDNYVCHKLINNNIETLAELKLHPRLNLCSILQKNKFTKFNQNVLFKILDEKIPIIEWRCFFSTIYEIKINETATLLIKFRRDKEKHPNIFIKKWEKTKIENWFIIIGFEKKDKLILIKRIYVETQWRKIKLKINTLELTRIINLKVFLLSDSHLGLDQEHELLLKIESKTKDNFLIFSLLKEEIIQFLKITSFN